MKGHFMKYKIVKRDELWYVLKKWWLPLPFNPRSLFMAGTSPFDECSLGFISEEIAEAAIKKYPNGKICLDIPILNSSEWGDPLLTKDGQRALLNK